MKNRAAKIAIRAVVFYFTLAGFCQSIDAQSDVRFRLVHDTVIVVSLMANNQGPFDFVLDTGTDTSVIDPSVARQLSLVSQGKIELNTLAGVKTVIRSSLQTLAAGPALAENVEVLVQDLGEFRKLDSHIQGIVGQNFLSQFNYLLDYRKRAVRVELDHEIMDAVDGEPVPTERRENMMIVPSEAQSRGGAKLRLLLDSGTNLVVLTRKASQAVDQVAQQNWLEVTSSGQAGMQVGRVRALTVGSQKFHDIAVALPAPQAADAERLEDGLLPTSLFNAMYVNNREGFLIFNPRTRPQAKKD